MHNYVKKTDISYKKCSQMFLANNILEYIRIKGTMIIYIFFCILNIFFIKIVVANKTGVSHVRRVRDVTRPIV